MIRSDPADHTRIHDKLAVRLPLRPMMASRDGGLPIALRRLAAFRRLERSAAKPAYDPAVLDLLGCELDAARLGQVGAVEGTADRRPATARRSGQTERVAESSEGGRRSRGRPDAHAPGVWLWGRPAATRRVCNR